MATYFLKDKML